MKLSDRDLKLLVIGLLAVVIVCPILFVLRPYNTKIEEINVHIDQLKERQAFLAKLNENRQFYNDSIALLTEERDKIIQDFAEGISDENNIMFLANTEDQIPIAMTNLAFSLSEPTVISETGINENGETVEGLSAFTSSATVSYQTSYQGIKDFLQFIMDNPKRMVISSVTLAQDGQGFISGVFVLNAYAVTGEGRELAPAKIPAIDKGVEDIFGIPELEEEEETPIPEEGEAE